jgi:hypothetical protein
MQTYHDALMLAPLALLLPAFAHALVEDTFDPLSAEQVAELRQLSMQHPSVDRLVQTWLKRNRKLRVHHLEKAQAAAKAESASREREREARLVQAEMSLLVGDATRA